MQSLPEQLMGILNSTPSGTAYCVFDTVQASLTVPEWKSLLKHTPPGSACILGQGAETSGQVFVLPWLVAITAESPWWEFLVENAGKNLGIYLYGVPDLFAVATTLMPVRHAVLPSGNKTWFRFYDPRTFVCFFPSATESQKNLFFGNAIEQFFAEDCIAGHHHHFRKMDVDMPDERLRELAISPEQKENLDESGYQHFLFRVFTDVQSQGHTAGLSENEVISTVTTLAEWGYEHGMTEEIPLHSFILHAFAEAWDKSLAEATATGLAGKEFDNQQQRFEYVRSLIKKYRTAA